MNEMLEIKIQGDMGTIYSDKDRENPEFRGCRIWADGDIAFEHYDRIIVFSESEIDFIIKQRNKFLQLHKNKGV